jgi:hypothetical protein
LCYGGDPGLCDGKVVQWLSSLQLNPMPVEYSVGPLTELIRDPVIKANLEKAVAAWVEQANADWDAIDTCPVCDRGGICATPSSICQCAVHSLGNACSQCATGWTGTSCSTAVCAKSCLNTGTCIAPDTCKCPLHGAGPQCQCAAGWGGAGCAAAVCSPACLNGGKCISPNSCQCPDHGTGSRCECATGWGGADCADALCSSTVTCHHGCHCTTPNGHTCSCGRYFYGTWCQNTCPISEGYQCWCGFACEGKWRVTPSLTCTQNHKNHHAFHNIECSD